MTIPVHEGCNKRSEKGSETSTKSSERSLESSGTSSGTGVTSSGTRQKTSEKIIELINADPQITASKIAMELGISTRGVEKNLRQLREAGILRRIGSPTFGGYWEITVT
ncbi:MAG: HTH domain-containing protein [Bacteroidales bacterium]|nr:HTH domain-containing protein [Bacteroidales bacterium]